MDDLNYLTKVRIDDINNFELFNYKKLYLYIMTDNSLSAITIKITLVI